MPKKHNADYRRVHLSQDILLKRITRDEALNKLKHPAFEEVDQEYISTFVAHKLDYSLSELENIINQPPIWYVDLPNREKILKDIHNIFRLITNRKLSSTWW